MKTRYLFGRGKNYKIVRPRRQIFRKKKIEKYITGQTIFLLRREHSAYNSLEKKKKKKEFLNRLDFIRWIIGAEMKKKKNKIKLCLMYLPSTRGSFEIVCFIQILKLFGIRLFIIIFACRFKFIIRNVILILTR